MGRQRGQSSIEVRKLIISHHEKGKTVREIAETKSVENKKKSGRPKLFSAADERWIVQQIKKNPNLSALSSQQKSPNTSISTATPKVYE